MVAPKPNNTRLTGTIREVRPHERGRELLELIMDVDAADEVHGHANLLAHAPGHELCVTTDAKDVAALDLHPGDRVVVGAEVRGPGAVWARPRGVRRRE